MKKAVVFTVIITMFVGFSFGQTQPEVKFLIKPKGKKVAIKTKTGFKPPQFTSNDTIGLTVMVNNANLMEDSVFIQVLYGKGKTKLMDTSFVLSSNNSAVNFSTVSKYYKIDLGEIGYQKGLAIKIKAYDRNRKLIYKTKTW